MRSHTIENFKSGIINNIEAQSIPDGAASDSLNFLTKGDRIELRRGSLVIGDEVAGSGKVSGLFVAHKANGSGVKYKKIGRKLLYFNTTTLVWVEVGTDIFPVAATNDNVTFAEYQSLAGAQLWFSSPNSSLYKIMTANPGSYADMYDASKNFKGYIRIKLNRMGLWGRLQDLTGYYGSYIDNQIFTTVAGEATASLGGTLAFKAGGAKRTCFGVQITITAGGEVYTDDFNGILTGSLGGTGTIDYMTGAYTLSNPGVGTASYQWEDSTNKGIADFTKSGSRLAGEGFTFRQDDGGTLMNVESYGDVEYCIHEFKTWALSITSTDTNATNLIFRDKIGIPFLRASVATGSGIYLISVTDENNPIFTRLSLVQGATAVTPNPVTLKINLTGYIFDQCDMEEWNDYILFTGRTNDADTNNRLFLYNKIWGSIDVCDYFGNVLAIDGGTLIAGESISNNVVTLFSGYDDDDSEITGYWIGNVSNLLINDRLKKCRKLILRGLIQKEQKYKVYISSDAGQFIEVGEVDGSASYVDKSQSVAVGALTIGSNEVGGGGEQVIGYEYLHQILISLDKFENLQLKIVPEGIGYVSLSKIIYHDIRLRTSRLPIKYR